MKTLRLTKYEIEFLKSALNIYEDLVAKEEFPPNTIVTKEFVLRSIQDMLKKISKESEK